LTRQVGAGPLADRLSALERAAADARELGLLEVAARADGVLGRARERAGFPGDAYVLVLAGGTGVGKSSVLNALAGREISAARATRPTTEKPVAWIAESRRAEIAPLLTWLGVGPVVGHAEEALANVAVLDLPDFDSVRTENRAVVDELLPRVDALAWVLDPEKYDDERFHEYLRGLTAHAPRMWFLLNKVDRVPAASKAALEADLGRRLSEAGIGSPRILAVSAQTGEGIDAVRAAIGSEADAKALVVARLATDAREAVADVAAALGVEAGGYRPLVDASRREAAIRDAVAGALAVMDPPGVARQMRTAVMARARRTGGSLLSRVVRLLSWMTGHHARTADPAAYLRAWRNRGSIGRILNPVRASVLEAAHGVPAESRAAVLRGLDADELEPIVVRTLDGVARQAAEQLRVPGSWLWPVIGAVQLVIGAVFAFAVAWYATLFLSSGVVPVTTTEVPYLGQVPLPLLLLAGSVAASAVLGFLLGLHAGWIGRRRARRVAEQVRVAVAEAIATAGSAGLERLEAVRARLAADLEGMT
jgi:GTP-binding protein EngB required for normal cell division